MLPGSMNGDTVRILVSGDVEEDDDEEDGVEAEFKSRYLASGQ